jgi:hypothetical protein
MSAVALKSMPALKCADLVSPALLNTYCMPGPALCQPHAGEHQTQPGENMCSKVVSQSAGAEHLAGAQAVDVLLPVLDHGSSWCCVIRFCDGLLLQGRFKWWSACLARL